MDEGSRQGSGPSSEVAIEREDKEVEESGTSAYTYASTCICLFSYVLAVLIQCT